MRSHRFPEPSRHPAAGSRFGPGLQKREGSTVRQSKPVAIPGMTSSFSQLYDIKKNFRTSRRAAHGCRRHNLPSAPVGDLTTAGVSPSKCPAYGFFGGATLSSRPCDTDVASAGLLPGPACDSRAASGNRLQAMDNGEAKEGQDPVRAGRMQSGASWAVLLTTGVTS
jgi:hypothetical protein